MTRIEFSRHLAYAALIAASVSLPTVSLASPEPAPQATAAAPTPAQPTAKPEETEIWDPVPKVVTPGAGYLHSATLGRDHPVRWQESGRVGTVRQVAGEVECRGWRHDREQGTGNIETKKAFKNYQLHIEWRIPEDITGSGQARGNSGVFLASTGPGDAAMSCRFSIRTTTRPM